MRDCLFLVADKNMKFALQGVFGRTQWHHSLGTAPFLFDLEQDVHIAVGQNDPGIYKRGNELLQKHQGKWRHAVMMMDAEWDGCPRKDKNPDAAAMRHRLEAHLTEVGWAPPEGLALVIEPEVDAWLWTDSPHTPNALGWASWEELWGGIEPALLPPGEVKPSRPKEAAERALRLKRLVRSSNIYAQVSNRVSIPKCQETSVVTLIQALQQWFPPGGEA